MDEVQKFLRLKFEAETDIVVNEKTACWKQYALWLERAQMKILRKKVIKENNILRVNIHRAIKILDDAITARIPD
ncbi:MAG: hypothetical protein AB1650_01750 [Candidatus Omnitrophota bacterium]